MILLRQVSKYVYDVFSGNGYDNWTRVRKNTWGVNVVGGTTFLNRNECKRLDKVILQHPMGNLEVVEV